MKNKKLLLSLVSLIGLTSCGGIASHNTFFAANYLENLNLFNMPTIEVDNTRLYDGTHLYYTTTQVEFDNYASKVFTYLIERETMKYVLYKGEARSDLLDSTYNRYNVYASENINDYKIDNGYYFIFSYTDLNNDTSLQMAFSITLEYYNESSTNELFEEDFTYNALMKIEGIDKPHYYFYTIND